MGKQSAKKKGGGGAEHGGPVANACGGIKWSPPPNPPPKKTAFQVALLVELSSPARRAAPVAGAVQVISVGAEPAGVVLACPPLQPRLHGVTPVPGRSASDSAGVERVKQTTIAESYLFPALFFSPSFFHPSFFFTLLARVPFFFHLPLARVLSFVHPPGQGARPPRPRGPGGCRPIVPHSAAMCANARPT